MEDPSIRLAARLTVSAAFLATLLGSALTPAPIHPLPPAHVFGRYATKPPQASSSVASVVEAEHVDPIVTTPARPIVAPNTGSHEDVVAMINQVFGFHAAVARCIASHESGYNPLAVNVNSDRYHSRDRGVFQLNDHWHPDVSDAQAFDPAFNISYAFRMSAGGTNWNAWYTKKYCV